MPRKVSFSDADLTWLQENHQTVTYKDMANRLNCCVDTLKRILVRQGLQEFDGAKYQLRRDFKEKVWQRPCMNCGCDEPRPKNWFFCRPCRKELGYDD
mgnify:CR=1 FL=1|tara:strand:+ start:572 stop:865 length:294 start_codon:yes stop_codon:yes gene_type:complete